ncbi:MAG: PilN domain-containing protein [Sedimentisphaerales bacterium]|nr:PilN domain-containing protein [Sedimentisphaerales bacterium]
MKEIDFLPKWYKSGKRQQFSYRAQYAGIGGVFAAVVIWSFITTYSLSKAEAEFAETGLDSTNAGIAAEEFARLKNEAELLQGKAKTIEKIDSNIDVASVLAEISYLIDTKIVLSKVEFIAERFEDGSKGQSNVGTAIKAAAGKFSSKDTPPLGDVRFKILINGVALNASNVAVLICKLEDSPYFCQVIPLFTRNREMKTKANTEGEKFQMSEFEISCNLANYRQEDSYFAREPHKGKAAGL